MVLSTTITFQMVLAFTGYVIDNGNILYSIVKEYLALDLLILDSIEYIYL